MTNFLGSSISTQLYVCSRGEMSDAVHDLKENLSQPQVK